jgi:hypothetical protein
MGDDIGVDGSTGSASNAADNNSLISSLAGDATKVGTAFFAAQAASSTAKSLANSPYAQYFVYGGVAIAGLIVIYLLMKK